MSQAQKLYSVYNRWTTMEPNFSLTKKGAGLSQAVLCIFRYTRNFYMLSHNGKAISTWKSSTSRARFAGKFLHICHSFQLPQICLFFFTCTGNHLSYTGVISLLPTTWLCSVSLFAFFANILFFWARQIVKEFLFYQQKQASIHRILSNWSV